MGSKKKSWTDRLTGAKPPHVVTLEKSFAGVPAGAPLLISDPPTFRDLIQAIPLGRSRTARELRTELATKAGAADTCPVTTGIFLRIVAEAVLEEMAAGKKPAEITPFWRVVAPRDPLAQKLSCGPEFIKTMREMEEIA